MSRFGDPERQPWTWEIAEGSSADGGFWSTSYDANRPGGGFAPPPDWGASSWSSPFDVGPSTGQGIRRRGDSKQLPIAPEKEWPWECAESLEESGGGVIPTWDTIHPYLYPRPKKRRGRARRGHKADYRFREDASIEEGKVKAFLLQGQEAGAPNFRFTDRESGKWKNLNCANCSSFKSESGSGPAQKGSCKKYGNKCMGMTVCDAHSSAVGRESIEEGYQHIHFKGSKSARAKLAMGKKRVSVQGRTFDGELLIHPAKGANYQWNVSHIRTGLSLAPYPFFADDVYAVKFAKAASQAGDWSFDTPEEMPEEIKKRMSSLLKSYKKHIRLVGGGAYESSIEEAQGKSVGTKLDYIVDRKSAVTIFDRVSGKQFKIEGDEGKSLANELESAKSIKSMATTLQGYAKLLEHCGHSEGIEETRKWSRWWPEVENPRHQWSPTVGEGTRWEQSSPTKKEQRRIRRAEHEKLVAKALRAQGVRNLTPIDPEEYPPIRGMEGPFQFRRGFILYYDPKEGRYYDRKRDMYASEEEMAYALGFRESDDSIEEADEMPDLTKRGHIGFTGKVFVYRNLAKGPAAKGPPVWSIKALSGPDKGRVIGHDTAVVVRDVRFTVGDGRAAATVRRKMQKGVHAGVVGFISDESPKKSGTAVTYNPYKYSSFATIKGEHPVTAAKSVTLWDKGGTIWAKGAVVDKTKSALLPQESIEEKWWHNEPSAQRMVMKNLAAGGIPEGPAWEASNFLREMGYTDAQLRKLLTKGQYSEDFINEVCGGGVYHPLGKNKSPLGKSSRKRKPGRDEEEFDERSLVPIPGQSFSPYEKQKPG